jgi:hypothetical protein
MSGAQQLFLALPTLAIGWLMLYAGLGKKRLAWREPGICRGCKRPVESCSCPAPRRRVGWASPLAKRGEILE